MCLIDILYTLYIHYRPPNSNTSILSDFETLLRKLDDTNIDIIITGDLNCDMMANNPTHHTKRLSDLINEFQLKQHITSPTRITPSSKTLIDIIMTKASDTKIIDSGVIHLGLSDHSLVYICRKIGIPRAEPKIVETRQFKLNTLIHLHFNTT